MPSCLIEKHNDKLPAVPFRNFIEKEGKHFCSDLRQDKRIQGTIKRAYRCIDMGIFSDNLCAYHWPYSLGGPTPLGNVDAAESRLILEHEPHPFIVIRFLLYFLSKEIYEVFLNSSWMAGSVSG
jgi:hypothetical protein